MKDWVFGRVYMEEASTSGGEGGGGGSGGDGSNGGDGAQGGSGGDGDNGGDGAQGGSGGDGGAGGGEDPLNSLGKDLDGEGEEKKPKEGEGEEKKPQEGDVDLSKPMTDAEKKAYTDALKLDEKIFGKGIGFDERYAAKLPDFFRKYGIDPEKANKMANEFAAMQRDVDADQVKKAEKYREWRANEMQKMNEAFLEKYDKPARKAIGRAVDYFFKKGTPMFDIVRRTEVGVDPGFLEAMAFIGERLPADAAPGAAAGSGSGGKSISDSFMGI